MCSLILVILVFWVLYYYLFFLTERKNCNFWTWGQQHQLKFNWYVLQNWSLIALLIPIFWLLGYTVYIQYIFNPIGSGKRLDQQLEFSLVYITMIFCFNIFVVEATQPLNYYTLYVLSLFFNYFFRSSKTATSVWKPTKKLKNFWMWLLQNFLTFMKKQCLKRSKTTRK